ncbi:hypothetical protein [Sandaracinus amylolyticus]|uniref:hypothetical protein n=1 Tax=Sandaracinus amylolyticus TaxID=927083 RepID=UPI001F3D134E|nr:hypothetical protein [Sandaracinus amylolyticus]UJR82855.1 Hypothetical protein I5071_49200 [Sandaracinus amylolyticus]
MRRVHLLAALALVACSSETSPSSCDEHECDDPARVCVERDDGLACVCRPGTVEREGACVAPDACSADTCSHHGTCDDASGAPICACERGYDELDCSGCADGFHDDGAGGCTDQACEPDPCPADRRCIASPEGARCECPAGTHDDDGACVPDTTCLPTSCNGHGSCDDASGRPSCACEEGWIGASCDGCDEASGFHDDGAGGCTMDPCLPNPCTAPSQSVCAVIEGGEIECRCDPGFHLEGGACVIDETCEASSCGDHGTCAVVDGRIVCTCETGWTGDACDACDDGYHDDGAGGCTTDVCLPNPCTAPSQSVCIDEGGTARCECDPGYHSDGVGGCTDDPCVPSPCAAMGMACRVVGGSAECYEPPCDDDNPCTVDAFDGARCTHAPRPDGSSCSTTLCVRDQECSAGVCGGGTSVTCDDGNPCTRDSCDAITGCRAANDDTLVPSDGFACTRDRCSAGARVHTPDDVACDDGRWCTGTATCQPSAPSADASGCVVANVPTPPGPDGPCLRFVCNDTTRSFTRVTSTVGASCDDTLACTTSDRCTTSGACAGTPTTSCGDVDGACTGAPFGTGVDIPLARVMGRVTYRGSDTFPDTRRSYDVGLWLRNESTGVYTSLETVHFSTTWDGDGYPVQSTSESDDRVIDLPVLPGVYDVVYMRWTSRDDEGRRVFGHEASDPYPFALHVLQEDVVIGPGTTPLDVDVAPVRVTGAVRYAGSTTFPDTRRSYDVGLWLRDRATGVYTSLEDVAFSTTWDGDGYPVRTNDTSDDRAIDLAVLPGRYDVVYMRWTSRDDAGQRVLGHEAADPYPFAMHVLREDVVIGAGATSLDVDIAPVRVTGAVRYAGGTSFPDTRRSYNVGLWLRDRSTGMHTSLEDVAFSTTWDGDGYPIRSSSTSDDRAIDLAVLPGRYDVVYMRWTSRDDAGRRVLGHEAADPYPFALHLLREDVVIGPGSTSLDVDIAPVRVSGAITYAGSASFPDTRRSYNVGLWLRDRSTGIHTSLEDVAFSTTWDGDGYPIRSSSTSDDRVVDLAVLPGRYDLVYMRWTSRDDEGRRVLGHEAADPYPFAWHVLREDVAIGAGSSVIDVDIAPVRITGAVTFRGSASFPDTRRSYNVGLWLRDRATGMHTSLEDVAFSTTWDGDGYPIRSSSTSDDRVVDLAVLPGRYDVVYMRWTSRDDAGDRVFGHESADPYPFAHHALREDVVIDAGARAVSVDLAPVRLSGAVTYAGGTSFPDTTRSYDVGLWMRDRSTGMHTSLEDVAFSTTWDGDGYPIRSSDTSDDRVLDIPVFPGTYDVVYMRWTSRDDVGRRAFGHQPDDAYPFAHHTLQQCRVIE